MLELNMCFLNFFWNSIFLNFWNLFSLKFKKLQKTIFSLFLFFFYLFFFPNSIFSQQYQNNSSFLLEKTNNSKKQTNFKKNRKNITRKNSLNKNKINENINQNKLSQQTTNNFFTNFSKQGTEEVSFTGFYIRTFIILFIGFLVLYFGIKFIATKKKNIRTDNEIIEVVFEYPLLLNRQIMIVKIFKEYYILGVTSDNISLIDQIKNNEQIDSLMKYKTKEKNFSFKKILEETLSFSKKNKTTKKTSNENLNDLFQLKDKIDKI